MKKEHSPRNDSAQTRRYLPQIDTKAILETAPTAVSYNGLHTPPDSAHESRRSSFQHSPLKDVCSSRSQLTIPHTPTRYLHGGHPLVFYESPSRVASTASSLAHSYTDGAQYNGRQHCRLTDVEYTDDWCQVSPLSQPCRQHPQPLKLTWPPYRVEHSSFSTVDHDIIARGPGFTPVTNNVYSPLYGEYSQAEYGAIDEHTPPGPLAGNPFYHQWQYSQQVQAVNPSRLFSHTDRLANSAMPLQSHSSSSSFA